MATVCTRFPVHVVSFIYGYNVKIIAFILQWFVCVYCVVRTTAVERAGNQQWKSCHEYMFARFQCIHVVTLTLFQCVREPHRRHPGVCLYAGVTHNAMSSPRVWAAISTDDTSEHGDRQPTVWDVWRRGQPRVRDKGTGTTTARDKGTGTTTVRDKGMGTRVRDKETGMLA